MSSLAKEGVLLAQIPHSKALGMHVVEAKAGRAVLRVPYSEHLVGNPETGVLHGGVITSTLDNASGMAVYTALGEWRSIATLDLRIDYMKPATPGKDLMASAHCYKVTRSIAFVRGIAYHDDPEQPIATTTATFMIAASPKKRPASTEDGANDKS